jgi:hypothetical protein
LSLFSVIPVEERYIKSILENETCFSIVLNSNFRNVSQRKALEQESEELTLVSEPMNLGLAFIKSYSGQGVGE